MCDCSRVDNLSSFVCWAGFSCEKLCSGQESQYRRRAVFGHENSVALLDFPLENRQQNAGRAGDYYTAAYVVIMVFAGNTGNNGTRSTTADYGYRRRLAVAGSAVVPGFRTSRTLLAWLSRKV